MQTSDLSTLHQYYGASLAAFLFCLLVTYIAKKNGFFRLPTLLMPSVSLAHLAGGFFTYIFANLILVPAILFGISYLQNGRFPLKSELKEEIWWVVASLIIIFAVLVAYAYLIRRTTKVIVWGRHPPNVKSIYQNIGWGMIAWCVSYPAVILFGLLANIVSLWIWGKAGVQQTAVKYLLNAAPYPILYIVTIILLITVVPMVEEFLFRGLLQSFLRRFIGRVAAIILTAAIFSIVHFSSSQGTGNFELIVSLFILACFLGFIYERQQTLWAPIGLHMSFNAFSILLLNITGI